jgi:Uma2 family endonuclease
MTATLTPPEQVTQKVILDNISWETYQRLMEERGERPKPRYAYDRGRLEIKVSSYQHENLKHMIATLVELLAGELEIDIEAAASTTFQREDLAQGFEPDASFYIQQAARIRGQGLSICTLTRRLSWSSKLTSRIHRLTSSRSSRAWGFRKCGVITNKP